jgi:hypothetical protein
LRLDLARMQVRRYHLAILTEMVDRWGAHVDGIELDFMRHPAFFRIEEAAAQGYLLTDLVAAVQQAVRAAAAKHGKPLELIVRVPPTLEVRLGRIAAL